MVTFIDDQIAVLSHAIIHQSFVNEALHERDIQRPGQFFTSTAQSPDCFRRQIEEGGQAFDPLFEELLAVNQNQGINTALRNQPGCNHGFPKRRRCGQNPDIFSQQRVSGHLLVGAQCAGKRNIQWNAGATFIAEDRLNTERLQSLPHFIQATSRKAKMLRVIFSASNDSWLVVGRKTHGLRAIKLRVLKRCQSQ